METGNHKHNDVDGRDVAGRFTCPGNQQGPTRARAKGKNTVLPVPTQIGTKHIVTAQRQKPAVGCFLNATSNQTASANAMPESSVPSTADERRPVRPASTLELFTVGPEARSLGQQAVPQAAKRRTKRLPRPVEELPTPAS